MKRRARIVRRSWVPAVAALVVVALTASLGVWQLRRADEKAIGQASRDAALAAPATRLGATPANAAELDGRRVTVQGHFEPARTVLLDNRTHRGAAGFHVLTPLRLDEGGAAVMVLRGWVGRDLRDRTRPLDYLTPTGSVVVEGLAERELQQPMVLGAATAESDAGSAVRQHFDLDAWRRSVAPDALPVIVRQTSALDDRLVREWPQPGSGVDRHRGYALQWFAMAAVTVFLWWRFSRRRDAPDEAGRDA